MILNDDLVLIKKASNGDSDAFGQLIIKYQNLVYNVCYQFLRNSDDAYDVSQDVFLKAYRSIRTFRGECSFSTWLYRITQNAVKDHISRETRHRTVQMSSLTIDDDKETEIDLPDSDENGMPDVFAERKDTIKAVRDAISALPEMYKEVIVLRDIEERSYEEIAEMLGIELGTVKSRIYRARISLKEFLEKGNFFNNISSNSMK
ncbi:MAG: sigma-70 family RNA polymerase sigma factor [Ruminococcaceae bacterium]|nr:sigma-70 family RNA polymerase sigma factor [Oscillospiraceae bacterium]